MTIAAKRSGIKNIIVPLENVQEACLVNGINVYSFDDLKSVINFLEGTNHAERIIESGNLSLKSDYPIDFSDVKGQQVLVEYIVVAAAGGHNILVIEAGEKSGSLITANYGKQYGREILALPDNIYSQESMGSNRLIYDGAKIYLHEEQLLIDNRYESKLEGSKSKDEDILDNLDETEKRIVKILLAEGSKTLEELSDLIELNIMELLEKLSLMELEDKVIISGSVVSDRNTRPYLAKVLGQS